MRRIRRLLGFLATRVFWITLVSASIVASFYTALNTANIWILVDEGLEARVRAVVQGTEQSQLGNYFTPEFIAQDPVLAIGMGSASPYRDYTVRGFTHKTQFQSIWAWPWESVARAEVYESVPSIDGTVLSSRREAIQALGDEALLKPPAWEDCKYRVILVRNMGRWRISGLQRIE